LFLAGTITNASVQVDVVDAARAYNLDVRVNGVSVATLALPVSTLGADTCTAPISVAVACGDIITAFMVRTAGGGASTFNNEGALVEIQA
jgi:hypothetical protein